MQPPGLFRLHSPCLRPPPPLCPRGTDKARSLARGPRYRLTEVPCERSGSGGGPSVSLELSLLPLPASLSSFIPNHKWEKLATRPQKNVLSQHATRKWRLFFHFQKRVSYTKSMVQHAHLDRRWSFFGQ